MLHGKLISEHLEEHKHILAEDGVAPEKQLVMSQLLGATTALVEEGLVNESTVSGDVAGYDKFIFRLVERGYPAVIGVDIFGVQVLNGPTGMIFALYRGYAGDDNAPTGNKYTNSVILVVDTVVGFTTQNTAITAAPSGATGNIIYGESGTNFLLVRVTGGVFTDADVITAGAANANVAVVDENILGYKHVFKDYSKFTSVALGEVASTNIKQVNLNIQKVTATAETHKLKAKYTEELRQDLYKLHRKDAAEILSGIAAQEFALELNSQLLVYMKASAATGGIVPYDYNTATGISQKQKIESLLATIHRAGASIARTSMMGFGNFIVTDVEVYASLDIMGFIDRTMIPNKILDPTLNAFGGILVGRYKVFIDIFEDDNVIYVGYKDMSGRPEAEWKAGYYFCPYIPVEALQVRDPNSGQPALIFATRYALVENPYGAENFYRKITVANLPN